ncbi:hypothetical protein [Butyrivibrio virus Arian]|nr:hypothetical protein [Butyrivibrio virus Arian]
METPDEIKYIDEHGTQCVLINGTHYEQQDGGAYVKKSDLLTDKHRRATAQLKNDIIISTMKTCGEFNTMALNKHFQVLATVSAETRDAAILNHTKLIEKMNGI